MGSIKAMLATVLTTIKTILPKVAITATAVAVTTGTIYYYTINDAAYVSGDTSNVPYVVNREIDKVIENLNNEENLHNYLFHKDEYYIANLEELVKNIMEELDKNDSVIREYISKRHLKEYLKDFIKAELVTVYPDLRATKSVIGTDSADTRLQGHIKLIRYSRGNDGTPLTYVTREKFGEEINNYNTSGNEEFKEHFTISENGDLIIGGWSSTTNEGNTTQSAYETSISYKQQIQNYTMPFDFLWGLLVMGEDEEFVHNLAKLACDSQITIGIYDNTTITEEKTVKTYTQQTVKTNLMGMGANNPTTVENEEEKREEKNITTTQSNTLVDLVEATTWLVKYNKDFHYQEVPQSIPNNWEADAEWTSLNNEQVSYNDVFDNEIKYTEAVINTDVKTANISATSTYSYTSEAPEIKELIDEPKYKRNNFVYFLRRSESALKFYTDSPEWMYEILASSEKTSNMVDLFKYLLYKTTGNDYGVTDISDFLNTLTSMFGNFVSLGNDFIVHTDMMPEIVLDKEKILETIGKKYSGGTKTNLESVIDDLMKIQNENKVNAVFAIAVTIIESSGGTNWDAIIRDTHNWMSVSYWQGTLAPSTYKSTMTWCSYDSFNQATQDFGKYISTKSNYFQAGNYSVKTIAPAYCGTAWGESVVSEMKSFLSVAGVNVDSIMAQYNTNSGVLNGMGWWFPMTASSTGYDIGSIHTTQRYGNRGHGGEDIVGGDRIIASRGGTVSLVQKWNGIVTRGDMNSYGNLVIIDHGDGYKSFYAHLSSISVAQGQQVNQGQDIGIIGSTGNSTGPHLHFEIQFNGKRQDPMKFVSYTNPYATSSSLISNVNMKEYKVLNNVNDFVQYAKQRNYYQGAEDAWSDHCLGFSEVYCEAIKTRNFDIVNKNKNKGNSPILKYAFKEFSNNNQKKVLEKVYEEINKGNPCVLQVNGNSSGTSRHYVVAVGYKNSVKSAKDMNETDILIVDVWDAKVESLTGKGSGSRFMTMGTQTGYQYGYQIYTI